MIETSRAFQIFIRIWKTRCQRLASRLTQYDYEGPDDDQIPDEGELEDYIQLTVAASDRAFVEANILRHKFRVRPGNSLKLIRDNLCHVCNHARVRRKARALVGLAREDSEEKRVRWLFGGGCRPILKRLLSRPRQ